MSTCPKCGHVRGPADASVLEGVCPACGIAIEKWLARQARAGSQPGHTPTGVADSVVEADENAASLATRLRLQFAELPEDLDSTGFWWRTALLAVLAVWTLWFAAHGVDWEVIGGSFLHRPNLAFHEFGHLFFRPFGEFMGILGGSLFQVLLPLVLAGFFVVRQRDNVAASVALWWCGQNFVDLAPYIRDAECRVLPLVGGGGEESHDWGNILTMFDAVDSCYALARGSFTIGVTVMLLALGWGGWLMWRWHATLRAGTLRASTRP